MDDTTMSPDLSTADLLLLDTGSLIERVDEGIDIGLARLTTEVAPAHKVTLDDLCDPIRADNTHGGRDDIAILGVRWLGGRPADYGFFQAKPLVVAGRCEGNRRLPGCATR